MIEKIKMAKRWKNDLYKSAMHHQYDNPIRYNELIRKARLLDKLVKYIEKGEKHG